jgi:exodeoxyribonuclease VII small subunit
MMNDDGQPELGLHEIQAILQHGSFEEAMSALELVVQRLEQGQLAIADAVDWYELGLALMHRCATLLDEAELNITTLEESYGLRQAEPTLWQDAFD